MFYEYSITPDVFDPAFLDGGSAAAVILTQLLKGICENGMISDLHKSRWSKDIARRVQEISSQSTKTNVMKLLGLLMDRRRLVRHPKAPNNPADELQWLELAREAHGRAPLDAIVLTPELLARCGIDDEILIAVDDVLNSDPWMNRRRSTTITMQETDYRNLLPKILRHARRLYLIDPYLRPEPKWTKTIEICASLMGQRGHAVLPGDIEIHTGDPRERSACRSPMEENAAWDVWREDRFTSKYPEHSLSVSMWEKFDIGERFHDRLLITDQVGFSIPGGLECTFGSATPSRTIWALLDEEDRSLWLSMFREGTSPYERIKS